MPFFRTKNILLVHIPKAAGISISIGLGLDYSLYYKSFSPTSSPIMGSNIKMGLKQLLKNKLQKYICISGTPDIDFLIGPTSTDRALQNYSVNDYINYGYLGLHELKAATKIACIRHPITRFCSLYSYWKFSDFNYSVDWVIDNCLFNPNNNVKKEVLITFSPMCSYLQTPWTSIKEFNLIRTESIEEDVAYLRDILGLSINIDFKKNNSSKSNEVRLTPGQKSRIRDYYAADFKIFKY
jgi:hypothetical protein